MTTTNAITVADEQFLRDAATRIRLRMQRTAQDIIEIGRDLIAVKERLGHGHFLPWIEREFDMSESAAQKMMAAAREFGDNSVTVTDLTPSVLYALAAPSTPPEVRTEIVERAAAGEHVTVNEVSALKRKLKERNSKIRELTDQRDSAFAARSQLMTEAQVRTAEITDLTRRLEAQRVPTITQTEDPVMTSLSALWEQASDETKEKFKERFIEQDAAEIAEGSMTATTITVDPPPAQPIVRRPILDEAWLKDKLRFLLGHVRHLPKERVIATLETSIKEVRKSKVRGSSPAA